MPENSDIQVLVSDGRKLSPNAVRAIASLMNQTIPSEMISQHPGKGHQTIRYIKHTHATQVLIDSGIPFNYDVVHCDFYPDGSASAIVKLTVFLPLDDGGVLERHVTEVGSVDNIKDMSAAMKIASAVSRALPRCMMRMFGWGIELYPDSASPPASWWKALRAFGNGLNVSEELLVAKMKELGITQETLAERYDEAVRAVALMAGREKDIPIE